MYESFHESLSSMSSVHSRPFVLWIGALGPLKGPLEVIDIAKALPAIDFVMIGSPYRASILDRLMKEKTPNIHYLGPVSDQLKNELIRQSSAGLTTSKYEGFGWTPFEFLIAGKPVLAYPLPVFLEVYGDLIIYSKNVSEFIKHLAELHRKSFKVDIDPAKVAHLERRWNVGSAGSRIVRLLGLKSLVIFTRDYPSKSNMILGADIFNWRLWRSISDTGIQVRIFANGKKYSTDFKLTSQTRVVGQPLTFLRRVRDALNKSPWTNMDIGSERAGVKGAGGVVATMLELALYLLEPVCYAVLFMRSRNRMPSEYVAASDISTILAGLMVKLAFGSKVVCIIHDTRFYDHELPNSSFPMKVYLRAFAYSLRYVDRILVVSKATLTALSRVCSDSGRFILIWEDK